MIQKIQKFIYIAGLLILLVPGVSLAQVGDGRQGIEARRQEGYTLSAASPNPFNPTTNFTLNVAQRQEVRVEVYNMLGQQVRRLYRGMMEAGETRTFTFEAGELPTGIYIYRVQGRYFSVARQVTLLK